MPMASAVTFSSNPESYMTSVGLPDFQNSNYVTSPDYEGIHIPTEGGACQRHSSDHSVNNPTEPYRGAALQEIYQPRLYISEQPKSKWRYRYQSEKGSHGGLPGINSTSNQRTFPTVKLLNFNGCEDVYVRASLWTSEVSPSRHIHKLCGPKCDADGTCVIKLNDDKSATFQDVTILFVAKKEVPDILFNRKLGECDSACISDAKKKHLRDEAEQEAKKMNLSSVKICFEAFYYAIGTKDCMFLCREFSDPVANQKSPDAGDLKICRISRYCGSVMGGDDVFLLVSKVNKKDIMVRFYESDSDWEAFGKFTEADVHYQYAIVFQTPPYHTTDIKNKVTVFLQLQRKNGEASEAKTFTYIPYDTDNERIGRKRKKNNPCHGFDGSGSSPYAPFGAMDHNAHGNVQHSALDSETVNGNSLVGNSSSCVSHSDIAERFLMGYFNEHVFDSIMNDSSDSSSLVDDNTALIKPHEDPLLSEANVPRPKWSLPDTPSTSVRNENASLGIETDSGSSEVSGSVSPVQDFIQATGERFSKLSIVEDRPVKESIVNSIPCAVNVAHPSKEATGAHTRKDGHGDSQKENMTLKMGTSQDGAKKDLDSLAKRIWNSLSLSIMKGNPFFFLKKLQHILNFSNEDGDTLLHLAVLHQWNNLDLVESLLKVFEGVASSPINLTNKEHQTALHVAVIMQKHCLVKLLLQYGADPTCPDGIGCTAIHWAAHNSIECLCELLNSQNYKSSQKKLHLEHFNHQGLAPLHCAVNEGSINHISLLCGNRADVNVQSKKDGRTPLHFAVDKDINVIRLLLKQESINVNQQDYGGNTALHLACAMQRREIVKELMLHDANPLIQNFEREDSDPEPFVHAGRTPYDFADQNKEIIEILAGVVDQQCETSSNFYSTSVQWQQPADNSSFKRGFPSCRPKEPSRSNVCPRRKSESELDKGHHATQADSGFISGSITLISEETLEKLSKLLGPPSNSWKDLIVYIGLDEAVQKNISKLAPSNPTKTIIEVFLRDGGDMETLIGALGAANLMEAQSILRRDLDSKN